MKESSKEDAHWSAGQQSGERREESFHIVKGGWSWSFSDSSACCTHVVFESTEQAHHKDILCVSGSWLTVTCA